MSDTPSQVDLVEQLYDENKALRRRIKRLEGQYEAADQRLSNLLEICRDNGIEVSSTDLIKGRKK